MPLSLDQVALLVLDYDEAIAFFTATLGLALIEDTDLGAGKRWVVVGGDGGARLLLARAVNAEQRARVGTQAGGRVGFFLTTDDLAREHQRLGKAGVRFTDSPRTEAYGKVAVFLDLYGNRWDLIEPART